MSRRFKRKDVIYVKTTVELPEKLRDEARDLGIGLSSSLIEALNGKIDAELERLLDFVEDGAD
jgi:hypothetical protein